MDLTLYPRLVLSSPAVERALRVIKGSGDAEPPEVSEAVTADIGSPERRLDLARAALSLRHEGRVPQSLPQPPCSISP